MSYDFDRIEEHRFEFKLKGKEWILKEPSGHAVAMSEDYYTESSEYAQEEGKLKAVKLRKFNQRMIILIQQCVVEKETGENPPLDEVQTWPHYVTKMLLNELDKMTALSQQQLGNVSES